MTPHGPMNQVVKQGKADEVKTLALAGTSVRIIAERTGCSPDSIARYLRTIRTPEDVHALKAVETSRLEIRLTKEIAEQHLGRILHSCENSFLDAVKHGETPAAVAWMHQYLDAIDKIFRVTGAYEAARRKAETEIQPQRVEIVWHYVDEPSPKQNENGPRADAACRL